MAQMHLLKCWGDGFKAIKDGIKTAEWRFDDRIYQPGDWLTLKEYRPAHLKYTGREVTARIYHVQRGPGFGIPEGYAMLSIRLESPAEQPKKGEQPSD